jgi:hypothetical protein
VIENYFIGRKLVYLHFKLVSVFKYKINRFVFKAKNPQQDGSNNLLGVGYISNGVEN